MSEWQLIDSAPKIEFSAPTWYRNGPRILLVDGPGCSPYFGRWGHTKTGKGRFVGDHGYVVSPMFWKEEPAPPEANQP